MTGTSLIYLFVKDFKGDFIFNMTIFIGLYVYVTYAPFGIVAGWELLTFRYESKFFPFLKFLYYIPKFCVSIFVGLIYLPFWLFKKIDW